MVSTTAGSSGACFLSETSDVALIDGPFGTIADIERIEAVPFEERLGISDFYLRTQIALGAHDPSTSAIRFLADAQAEPEDTSFATLRDQVDRVAALLRAHGIGRDDVVAIILPTMPAAYWAILGAMAVAIPFPINWMLEAEPLLSLIVDSRAKVVITLGPTPNFKIWESVNAIRDRLANLPIWSVQGPGGAKGPEDLEELLRRVVPAPTVHEHRAAPQAPDNIAAYLHSGGTTGVPKIVRLTHRNLSYRQWAQQIALRVEFGEIMLQDTPIFHVGGFAGRSLPMLASGARFVIPSILGARDKGYIANYWRLVERFGLTRLSGVPTMFSMLAKTPTDDADLSSLRPYFQTGSTSLPISVRRDFEAVSGVKILNSYGLTENTATVAVDMRDGPRKEGSSGVRAPYTRVRIVAGEGLDRRCCGTDEIGMIEVSGPGVTPGYLDESKTAGARTDDGWLITGDLGRLDEDQMLFVTGRTKDIIIRGGHNIDPGPIEDALLRSPEVIHAAAVGKPDAYAGELPVAYVQLVAGATLDEAALIALAAATIQERAAVPKQIFGVEQLPLTSLGKPDKAALRLDAVRRAFVEIFAALEGAEGVGVEVGSDPSRGTVVTVSPVAVPLGDRPAVAGRIDSIMEAYAFAYDVCWRDDVAIPA